MIKQEFKMFMYFTKAICLSGILFNGASLIEDIQENKDKEATKQKTKYVAEYKKPDESTLDMALHVIGLTSSVLGFSLASIALSKLKNKQK